MRAVLVLVGFSVLLSGCEFSCSVGGGQAKAVASMTKAMSSDLGVDVTLQCPKLEHDKAILCSAKTADGIAFPVEITLGTKKSSYRADDWVVGKGIRKEVAGMLADVHGIDGAEVECPSMVHLPKGTSAECKARIGDVVIPVRVSARDDGTLFYEPTGGLVIGRAAEKAVAAALAQKGVQARVSCPFKSRVSKPGTRFECPATDPTGTTKTIHYVVTDTDGGVSFGVDQPPAYPAAGAASAPPGAPK